nr:BCL2/adenovirus E1B 19 kDa protein-interacting protein 3 isoform X2 [Manis javanica]
MHARSRPAFQPQPPAGPALARPLRAPHPALARPLRAPHPALARPSPELPAPRTRAPLLREEGSSRPAHAPHAPHAPRVPLTRRPRGQWATPPLICPACAGARQSVGALGCRRRGCWARAGAQEAVRPLGAPASSPTPTRAPARRPQRLPSGAMSRSGTPGLQEENLQGSWVELHFSHGLNGSGVPASVSLYNGDLEKILLDAQHESGRSSSKSSHCDSPPRSQTPQDNNRASEADSHSVGEKNSVQSEEDYLERRKEVERILKKNSDWIWDWSSRPENVPPKEFLFRHPRRATALSMRNTSVMKRGGIFSAEFLKVFLPSLLLSHLLAVGLGIYIGRRLTTSTSTF